MDVFSWSFPFLAEKVTTMLNHILFKNGSDNSDDVDLNTVLKVTDEMDDKKKRQISMRNKVSSIARMTKMFSTLREERENLLLIKNISPDGKLPRGILLQGKPAIKNGNYLVVITLVVKQFSFAKELDR